jgi:hypothetical protein
MTVSFRKIPEYSTQAHRYENCRRTKRFSAWGNHPTYISSRETDQFAELVDRFITTIAVSGELFYCKHLA